MKMLLTDENISAAILQSRMLAIAAIVIAVVANVINLYVWYRREMK